MKILIISFYFPPHNAIASLRVGKIAKYLFKFGHEVKVISAKKDFGLQDLPTEIPAQDVVHTRWQKVAPERLDTGVQAVAAGADGLYKFLRACWRGVKSVIYFPDVWIGWIPYVFKAADELFRTWKPDIILVSGAPFSSLFAASRISKKYGIPWVADLRDLWTDNQCYPYGRIRKNIEARFERKVLATASGIVTVSEPLAEKIRLKFNGPMEIVCNAFDPSDYDLFKAVTVLPQSVKLRIAYIGTIYPDFHDPASLFAALKRFGENDIKVSFYGTQSPRLDTLVKKMGLEDRVELCDRVPYFESLYIQKNADVLLFFLWTDTAEKGVYTGKFFEYIGAGRPILGVGPDTDVAAALIKERGLGVILKDPENIYLQLKKWLDEKDEKGSIPFLSKDAGRGFSREEQTRKLEKFMLGIVNKQGGV
jgi:glycosyltransferase involved in cell wall biosynthesis